MNNGICEYVIGVIYDHSIRYWVGKTTRNGTAPELSTALADAKRYDDEDELREDLESLHNFAAAYKILEIQRCPKCHKEYTDYPCISREDNTMEICPECGVRESVEKYLEARSK